MLIDAAVTALGFMVAPWVKIAVDLIKANTDLPAWATLLIALALGFIFILLVQMSLSVVLTPALLATCALAAGVAFGTAVLTTEAHKVARKQR